MAATSSVYVSPLSVFTSELTAGGGAIMVASQACFMYVSRWWLTSAPRFVWVKLHNGSAGAGAQTAEIGLCTGTGPPQRAVNMTFTKLVATGTLGSLTAAGNTMVSNTSPFATGIVPGSWLYAMVRTNLAVTQPSCSTLFPADGNGYVQTLPGSGVLTGAGPFAASIPVPSNATGVPCMWVQL